MRFIGSKVLLLDNIKQVIDDNVENANTFCDIFSGTASVARYFKQWYEIYSNDLLYFSYVLQRSTIENDETLKFEGIKNITLGKNPIQYFNELDLQEMEQLERSKRLFQNTYSPNGGRMYITDENALRIDYVRNTIEEWKIKGLINENEYYYLVAAVIEGIPFVSNISGTYGAYHKTWDKRSFKKFELIDLEIKVNNKNNKCFNKDGLNLIKEISGDILYIDPPYNARQYLPNYHVLETAAKYDFPEVRGVTGQRPYQGQKSNFCSKKMVLKEFSELIKNANFKHIIVSYSTDGLMSVEEIESVMKKYGNQDTYKVYEIPYRRFKSRRLTKQDKLKELLFYVQK
ncbi:MAG: DNA adenine methylase [Clostridium sp.]